MTTPKGDIPDWQTLVTPQILVASILDQGAGGAGQIIQSGSPFRIWGVWVAHRFSSNNTFVTGGGAVITAIKDGMGNALLAVESDVRVANQVTWAHNSLPVPGFTPAFNAGSYQCQLVTSAAVANTAYFASGGILYSVP